MTKIKNICIKSILIVGLLLLPSVLVHAASGNFTSTYHIEMFAGHGFLNSRTIGMVNSGHSTFTVTLTPNSNQTLSVSGTLQRNGLLGWGSVGGGAQTFDRDRASSRTFIHNNSSGTYRIRLSSTGTTGSIASGSIRVVWTDI